MAYERDILDELEQQRNAKAPERPALPGLIVEDRASRFCGDVVRCTADAVTLRDRNGNRREFRLKPAGFLVDGKPVTLVRPKPAAATTPKVTNSGSVAAAKPVPAQVAKASRIWVEGKHDAELVEHVWGDDLRDLGVVVEPMHGIDDLAALVREFQPGPQRRLGVLVDHLVAGSKEWRLVAAVKDPNVLVTGHPFVDVWAGVWPRVLGIREWPDVPRGVPWKEGMCAALGTDLRTFWPRLRNRVTSYVDLRPELVGAVERLIDFVADGG
ncbi:MAG: DUF3097 family protein [Ilumatobacteraceae bacterium]